MLTVLKSVFSLPSDAESQLDVLGSVLDGKFKNWAPNIQIIARRFLKTCLFNDPQKHGLFNISTERETSEAVGKDWLTWHDVGRGGLIVHMLGPWPRRMVTLHRR